MSHQPSNSKQTGSFLLGVLSGEHRTGLYFMKQFHVLPKINIGMAFQQIILIYHIIKQYPLFQVLLWILCSTTSAQFFEEFFEDVQMCRNLCQLSCFCVAHDNCVFYRPKLVPGHYCKMSNDLKNSAGLRKWYQISHIQWWYKELDT